MQHGGIDERFPWRIRRLYGSVPRIPGLVVWHNHVSHDGIDRKSQKGRASSRPTPPSNVSCRHQHSQGIMKALAFDTIPTTSGDTPSCFIICCIEIPRFLIYDFFFLNFSASVCTVSFCHSSLHKNRQGYLRYTNCFTLPSHAPSPGGKVMRNWLFMFTKDLVSLAAGYDCMFTSFLFYCLQYCFRTAPA